MDKEQINSILQQCEAHEDFVFDNSPIDPNFDPEETDELMEAVIIMSRARKEFVGCLPIETKIELIKASGGLRPIFRDSKLWPRIRAVFLWLFDPDKFYNELGVIAVSRLFLESLRG